MLEQYAMLYSITSNYFTVYNFVEKRGQKIYYCRRYEALIIIMPTTSYIIEFIIYTKGKKPSEIQHEMHRHSNMRFIDSSGHMGRNLL